jgi:uncharacterized membrane protein
VDVILAAIGIAGVVVSAYLTSVHYAKVPLVCTTNGVVNCERVLSSPYSSIAGIPISAGGFIWFLATGGLAIMALTVRPEPRWLHPAQVLWSFAGFVTVLYLIGVEVLAVGALCAWCTGLHALILAALVLSVIRAPGETEMHTVQAKD